MVFFDAVCPLHHRPNPASDRVTLLFEKLVDARGIPEYLELLHESSTIPVRTLKVAESDFEVIKKEITNCLWKREIFRGALTFFL